MRENKEKLILQDSDQVSAADVLQRIVEVHQLKQMDLANRVGISQNYLSKVLNRKAFMSMEVALCFERVIGVSAKWLIELDTNYHLARIKRPTPQDGDGEFFLKCYDWAKVTDERFDRQ